MRHRSHRRKKLAKFADTYGMTLFKIFLVILAVLLAALLTYLISTIRA